MNGQEIVMTRRIGRTEYRVRVHFKSEGRDTMEDKLLRIISNHASVHKL